MKKSAWRKNKTKLDQQVEENRSCKQNLWMIVFENKTNLGVLHLTAVNSFFYRNNQMEERERERKQDELGKRLPHVASDRVF